MYVCTHHQEEPYTSPTYYKGKAYVLSGPATISSRKFNIKYRSGEGVRSWVRVWVAACVAHTARGTLHGCCTAASTTSSTAHAALTPDCRGRLQGRRHNLM
jgi:hypothetical protein